MMRSSVLAVALTAVALSGVVGVASAAPADQAACQTANAAVLVKAQAVVQAAQTLTDSDQTISDALLSNVKTAGVKVDAAVKAIQAVGEGNPIPPGKTADLAAAQLELQAPTKALKDAASSPSLTEALVSAKAALAVAIGDQVAACKETTPAPTPAPTTTAPAPTTTATPAPHTQIRRAPTGPVATGTA
jgi:hypothetical protein